MSQSGASVRVRVRVTGRVQGVGYRATCGARARELGVQGDVANYADGSVVGHFQGAYAAVNEIVAWCWRGPLGAHVDGVELWDEPPEHVQGFVVR